MDETRKFQKKRVCRGCRAVNDWEAKQCAECGADLEATGEQFADDDPKLRYGAHGTTAWRLACCRQDQRS